MIFVYKSESQVGPIEYRMDREKVRELLHDSYVEFKKNEFSANTTDAFDSLGVHVYYDDANLVDGVEIFARSGQVSYRGIDLLGSPLAHVLEEFSRLNIDFSEDSIGVVLENGSIGLDVPDKNENSLAIVKSAYINLAS